LATIKNYMSSRSEARDLLFAPSKPRSRAKTIAETRAFHQGTTSTLPQPRNKKAALAAEGNVTIFNAP
jgi:hypothetical protein